jgi:RNA-binding protein
MLPSTSPRKKSLMPSTPLRRQLRGLGHSLDPVVLVGKQGASEAVVKQVGQALGDHELIKVKVGTECPTSRFELAEALGAESGVGVVQILGRTILLYKRHPKKPKFEKPEKLVASAASAPAKDERRRPVRTVRTTRTRTKRS